MSPSPDVQTALDGRYLVLREIGQGGMAMVYLARDIRHDRDVALKVLRPELAAIIGADRFLAEIKVTAHLQHPHILPLFDSGSVGGVVYYVMPFIEGETLRGRLSREKQLPIADAVRIASEVASALDYAHRQGVIHRDVKPENILLHDGRALVADFGIALAVSSADSRMTETGMSLGTPQYMSPEQAMGQREITPRSDVYALGATTYEMLVGEPPYTGATVQAIVTRVLTGTPQPLTAQRHTISPEVEAAVLKSLERLPADRFATAADFAKALNVAPNSTGAGTVRVAVAPAATRSSRVRSAVIGGALLAAGAAAGWFAPKPGAVGASNVVSYDHLTFRRQSIFNARFAPDGKSVVYSASTSGNDVGLNLLRPDSPQPQPIAPPRTHLLAMSSQGEMAVLVGATYLYHRVFTGTLARLPIGGGAPRELKTDVREADWSPDGQALAIIVQVDGVSRLEYPVGKVRHESHGYLSDPRVSPDGRRVVFVDHPVAGDDRGRVGMIDTTAVAAMMLTPELSSVQGVVWTTAGDEVMYSAGADASHRAVHAVRLSGESREVLVAPGGLVLLDRAADGAALISRDDEPFRLVVHGPEAPTDSEVAWHEFPNDPVFSRDGTRLAFADQSVSGGPTYAVMLRQPDGSLERLGEGAPVAFSPDDKWLLVSIVTDSTTYRLEPVGAGAERPLALRGLKGVVATGWYPDGSAVLLCGELTAGAHRCYRAPVDGSALTPVTPSSPTAAAGLLSPDGTQVLVGARRFSGATDTGQVVTGLEGRLPVRWSADGAALFVRDGPFRVQRLELATGAVTPVFDATPPIGGTSIALVSVAVADDPRRYAYVVGEHTSKLFVARGVR